MRTLIDEYIDGLLDTSFALYTATEGYTSSRNVYEQEKDTSILTKDVAFRRRSFGEDDASPGSNGQVLIGTDGIQVELIQPINEPQFRKTVSLANRSAFGIDLDNLPPEDDWDEMLKGGIQTALETQVIVFGVTGVSRACTHQLVRTRKAAFHQQSQRSCYYGNMPDTRVAESVWNNDRARKAFLRAMYWAHKAYETAVEEDIGYQDARLILPEGTTNWILMEYPLRTFIDTYAYRGCSMFQWEHVHVMRSCRAVLVQAHPWLEPFVKISCEKTKGALDTGLTSAPRSEEDPEAVSHHCTYQGHEYVEGQCDFPWARESNRSFQPKHHRIGDKRETV